MKVTPAAFMQMVRPHENACCVWKAELIFVLQSVLLQSQTLTPTPHLVSIMSDELPSCSNSTFVGDNASCTSLSSKRLRASMSRSLGWLDACLAINQKQQQKEGKGNWRCGNAEEIQTLFFGVVEGGVDLEARRCYSREVTAR